ncbi:MAG: hypothetical protein REI94_14265 [Moraxellaceae bacterium]|nr:hypothetical protein [Moraxellaceae bacterium]
MRSTFTPIAFVFAALIALSELQIAMSASGRAVHWLCGGMATLLALLCATSDYLERRIFAENWGGESKAVQVATFFIVAWQLNFVVFLVVASAGLLISAVALTTQVSDADFAPLLYKVRRIGAACAATSIIPPAVMLIATWLGFKPHDET